VDTSRGSSLESENKRERVSHLYPFENIEYLQVTEVTKGYLR
jgi:hypothetical protein